MYLNPCKFTEMKIVTNRIVILAIIITFGFFIPKLSHAIEVDSLTTLAIDTTAKPVISKKQQRRQARKDLKQHFFINIGITFAKLHSTVRFEGPEGLLSTQVGLERHLGLASQKNIYFTTFIYRITPRSGLFASYYGLNRNNAYQLQNDIIFKGDTLKKGSLIQAYFNTQVFSIGYLLSILKSENSFLGVYFNAYLINVTTGVNSEVLDFDKSVGVIAPLPNFGMLAIFSLKKWLSLSGGMGIFFLNTNGLNGTFVDMNFHMAFKPAKWLSLNIGYQVFNVTAGFPVDSFRAIIDYNFSGPSAGIAFRF